MPQDAEGNRLPRAGNNVITTINTDMQDVAEKALEIRSILNLPEKYDTLSCLAGIKFKMTDFNKALELQKEVLENH